MNNLTDLRKLKVITVVGTRPEIIRLSRVIAKLDLYCDHVIVHTGQNYNYELNQIFFEDLGIRSPDFFLDAVGNNYAETIANIISKFDRLLIDEKPEAVLVLGDTNSSLCVIPAKRRKVPIFHMEAGNRCFDMRVPEEINRRIVDHTADVNLTYSDIARECLLREGLPSDLIIKTGSPMAEVLDFYLSSISGSDILDRLGLTANNYFVVSSHREENIDSEENFSRFVQLLNAVSEKFDLPVIVSTHPRTKKRIDSTGAIFHMKVKLLQPLRFTDYAQLQQSAKAVLSDSGTISEESSILNFPALNLRETQERHEAFEEASVMMVGMDINRVFQALSILQSQPSGKSRLLRQVSDYSMPNVSDKIVRIIHSYTDYVNRVIWKRC